MVDLGGRKKSNFSGFYEAAQGSNVRVGLEDSLWIGPGQFAKSNADQVNKIRHVLKGLSLDIASPDEARQMLGLKVSDQVDF